MRTALEVAHAARPRLWGVRLDTSRSLVDRSLWDRLMGSTRSVNAELVVEGCGTRSTSTGSERVKIVASGDFDAERIAFEESGVPVGSYGVGSAFPGNDYTATSSSRTASPRGRVSRAFKPNSASSLLRKLL